MVGDVPVGVPLVVQQAESAYDPLVIHDRLAADAATAGLLEGIAWVVMRATRGVNITGTL